MFGIMACFAFAGTVISTLLVREIKRKDAAVATEQIVAS